MSSHRAIATLLATLVWFQPVFAEQRSFAELLSALPKASFAKKTALVDAIIAAQHPRGEAVLTALMDGELFELKKSKALVVARRDGKDYALSGAVDAADLGKVKKRALRKVKTNNRLRQHIRAALASLALANPDPVIRLAAAQALLKNGGKDAQEPLRQALAKEPSPEVREAIELGLAVNDIESTDRATRLAAVGTLSGSLRPQALNALTGLLQKDDLDPEIRDAAESALKKSEDWLGLYANIENLFFGLSLGSVLLLAAIGLAVTFGVMGVINMAHGEMVMLGAYSTYVIQTAFPTLLEYSVLIAIPVAFMVTALVGILIERTAIRHLYGRPLETLLATFGISLILQQAVRTVFSPLNRSVSTPEWMTGSLELNPALAFTYNRIYIIVFAVLVLVGLMLLLKKTRFGLEMRAVTQNRDMARAMGIRTARVDAMTFGLGSGIAGMAGVALSQLTNVGPNMGQAYIVDSFMVVVFGGVGNLLGTFFGAMTLGVANKFLEPYAGAVLAKILVLVFIILFIQRRPEGLFALKGRAET